MKKHLLLAITACSFSQTINAQFTNETMLVGSVTRQYRQYLPTGFDTTTESGLPLVIAMHGLGDNYISFSGVGFQNVADTARFILVYPNGKTNSFGQNSWNNGALLSSTADDINFLSRIIDTMYIRHNIDLAKVYVCGFSMGGIMTYHALCNLPERIAAIASVSGPMSTADYGSCNPGRPVPVMHLHGTGDGTVTYSGSATPSVTFPTTTIAFWQGNNGCSDSTVTSLPDLVPTDTITVDRLDYNACSEPVQLWRENNANHVWLYSPANDIDATNEIWRFFRGKVHPNPSLLNVSEISQTSQLSVFQNNSQLTVSCNNNINEIMITDLQGKNIFNSKGNFGQQQQINLGNCQSQVLIVSVKCGNNYQRKKIAWMR